MTTTTDTQGRTRHAAGTPASIGGQYAPNSAPAAAATLPKAEGTAAIRAADDSRRLADAMSRGGVATLTFRRDPQRGFQWRQPEQTGVWLTDVPQSHLEQLAKIKGDRATIAFDSVIEHARTADTPEPLDPSELASITVYLTEHDVRNPENMTDYEFDGLADELGSDESVRAWRALTAAQRRDILDLAGEDGDDESFSETISRIEEYIEEQGGIETPHELEPIDESDAHRELLEIGAIADGTIGYDDVLSDIRNRIARTGYRRPDANGQAFYSAAHATARPGTATWAIQQIAIDLGTGGRTEDGHRRFAEDIVAKARAAGALGPSDLARHDYWVDGHHIVAATEQEAAAEARSQYGFEPEALRTWNFADQAALDADAEGGQS